MSLLEMTIEDFRKIPSATEVAKNYKGVYFDSVVILPSDGELHESGYKIMEFVLIDKDGNPFVRLTGCSDVIHLDGIGGFGYLNVPYKYNLDDLTPVFKAGGWRIDCLPCGLLRIFSGTNVLYTDDWPMTMSSFELYRRAEGAKQ